MRFGTLFAFDADCHEGGATVATWTLDRREVCIPDANAGMGEKRDWMTIAEELSKESNPARVMELSRELLEALDKKRRDETSQNPRCALAERRA